MMDARAATTSSSLLPSNSRDANEPRPLMNPFRRRGDLEITLMDALTRGRRAGGGVTSRARGGSLPAMDYPGAATILQERDGFTRPTCDM